MTTHVPAGCLMHDITVLEFFFLFFFCCQPTEAYKSASPFARSIGQMLNFDSCLHSHPLVMVSDPLCSSFRNVFQVYPVRAFPVVCRKIRISSPRAAAKNPVRHSRLLDTKTRPGCLRFYCSQKTNHLLTVERIRHK